MLTPEEKEAVKAEAAEALGRDDEARRETLAGLKSRLLEDIARENLKKEILGELRPGKFSLGDFLKHPASLLVVGFLLTTIFGTIITAYWKKKEWSNEQDYLMTQSRCDRERATKSETIKQKYEVKDDIIKGVAETNTAAEEILRYFLLSPARRNAEATDRLKYWKDASRGWRINSKVLDQRLLFRFKDPSVDKMFDDITMYRSRVGNAIDNAQEALSDGTPICVKRVNKAYECMSHVTRNIMPQMVRVMTEEILADEVRLREARCAADMPQDAASPTPAAADANGAKGQEPQPPANACEEMLQLDCTPKPVKGAPRRRRR